MCEARAALGGEIAGELDLLAERQHVRKQPRAEQHLGLDFLRRAVGLGLGEDAARGAPRICRKAGTEAS